MLNAILLQAYMLSAIMLNVVMANVVAPAIVLGKSEKKKTYYLIVIFHWIKARWTNWGRYY